MSKKSKIFRNLENSLNFQSKKIISLVLMSLMMVLMAGIVLAAFAFDRPDTNEYLKGTYTTINGTAWVGDSTNGNCTNTTVDYTTSGGSTYTYIGANTSLDNITGDWLVKESFVTNGLSDDTTYTMRAQCINDSNAVRLGTAITVNFKVDNTIPVFGSPTPSDSSTDNDGRVDFSIPCTNASSANLFINDRPPITMAESSDVCTYTADALVDNENKWYAIASDGLNSTTGSTYMVNVQRQGGFVVTQQAQIQAQIQREAQQKGLRGFINWLFSIPIKIINGIINVFK